MDLGDARVSSLSDSGNPRIDRTTRQIKGSEKGVLFRSWLGAGVPVVFSVGFFLNVDHPPTFIICLFLAIGLFFLGKAVWETIRLKRFGDPVLELNVVPISLGETVDGRITINSGGENAPEFTLTLACIHRVVTGSGKNRHVSEKVLWSDEKKASVLLGGILPVSMAVPADQPETSRDWSLDTILWRLTVKAPYRVVPFLEKYELPVYQARASRDSG